MNGKINRNIIIFGGTGDLNYRKLMPALYNLYAENKLKDDDCVFVIGRKEYTKDEYISIVKEWVLKYSRILFDEKIFENFANNIVYYKMEFTNLDEYSSLSDVFSSYDINQNLFYYAVSPMFFDIITDGIVTLKCTKNIKLVIEKPFGETIEEAEKLNNKIMKCFGKENIYRIDHYLGKEMVQSVKTIRFSNLLFKTCWNRNCIKQVDIVAHEEVGVETRASYYDKTGALKDMVQNHLMQILSLIAMEEPNSQYDIKKRQQQVFENLRPIDKIDIKKDLVLAQYNGYTEEANVAPNSKTETYAMCKLFIDNEQWRDVPFYIKTGKRMATREMNIVITFKPIGNIEKPDVLMFKVQPDEGVRFEFNIKKPGETEEIIRAEMDFCQSCAYKINTPEAYERLINVAMNGDQSLFSTWEHIYLSWDYINKLKQKYIDENVALYYYEQGSVDIDNILNLL